LAQKTVIMQSFLASKKYCLLGSCRRQNLLIYFGEETGPECGWFDTSCPVRFYYHEWVLVNHIFCVGNCDNCISGVKKQRDHSCETRLLLSCIRATGEHFGLNLPIDIIRGSYVSWVLLKRAHTHTLLLCNITITIQNYQLCGLVKEGYVKGFPEATHAWVWEKFLSKLVEITWIHAN
jgi:superfamily II DNA helicase RecQ